MKRVFCEGCCGSNEIVEKEYQIIECGTCGLDSMVCAEECGCCHFVFPSFRIAGSTPSQKERQRKSYWWKYHGEYYASCYGCKCIMRLDPGTVVYHSSHDFYFMCINCPSCGMHMFAHLNGWGA